MQKTEKGCVYFFKHIGLSPIKIGYSDNQSPINRFEQFKTYAPFGAELIGFIKTYNAKSLESELHRKYNRDRIKGEWFEITKNEAEKCISFYSNIDDIQEMNSFQIQWAKFNNKINEKEKGKLDFSFFYKFYSLEEKEGYEKIITTQKEVSSFLNVDKSEVKKIFNNLKLKYRSFRIEENVVSGVILYKNKEKCNV